MKMQLTFKKGHLYLEWNAKYAFFSKSDILKMHKRFAHPTPEKLAALLRRSYPHQHSSSTKRILDGIVRHCNSFQRIAQKPFVFQVTMSDKIQFNHEIIWDLAWIEPRSHRPFQRRNLSMVNALNLL